MTSNHRPQTVVATHIVLINDGHVLLQRRMNTGYEDGNYSLPAGHVEHAEAVGVATSREALEELGVRFAPETIKLLHVMHRSGVHPEDPPRVDFFMSCDSWTGDPQIMEPGKADALKWCALESLPRNTVPYVAEALRAISTDVIYSEHGWSGSEHVTLSGL